MDPFDPFLLNVFMEGQQGWHGPRLNKSHEEALISKLLAFEPGTSHVGGLDGRLPSLSAEPLGALMNFIRAKCIYVCQIGAG